MPLFAATDDCIELLSENFAAIGCDVANVYQDRREYRIARFDICGRGNHKCSAIVETHAGRVFSLGKLMGERAIYGVGGPELALRSVMESG